MSEVKDRSAEELAPIDQAAILLLAMGEDEAAKALNHIEPREVQRVGAAMAALGGVDQRRVDRVVSRFLETVSGDAESAMGASGYFRQMLTGSPKQAASSSLVQRLFGAARPVIGRLRWMDCRSTADYLSHQRPRLQAITLAYLEPERAAAVLRKLPGNAARCRALMDLARLETEATDGAPAVPPGGTADAAGPALGGRRRAMAILGCLDDVASAAIMAGIRREDPLLARELEAEQTRRRRGEMPAPAVGSMDRATSEVARFARFHRRINDTLDAQGRLLERLSPAALGGPRDPVRAAKRMAGLQPPAIEE